MTWLAAEATAYGEQSHWLTLKPALWDVSQSQSELCKVRVPPPVTLACMPADNAVCPRATMAGNASVESAAAAEERTNCRRLTQSLLLTSARGRAAGAGAAGPCRSRCRSAF